MDKPNDSEEASSSNTDPNSKPCNSARFVWQIKGEYHLKYSDDEESCDTPDDSSHEVKMENSSDFAENDIFHDLGQESQAEDHEVEDTATSQVRQRSRRDRQLLKWQSRQLAKAFVDNTINCVLEDMGFVPSTTETEDIINDGNLEHEAVSMAILSHGLQRSDNDTNTTSSHVDSCSSHSTYKSNRSPFQFMDGLSNLTRVKRTQEPYTCNNQMGPSCSFSSAIQNRDLARDVSSELATSEDSIIVTAENIMTAEHSKTHFLVQSHSNSLSPGSMVTQAQADCDVHSDSKREAHDILPIMSYPCSLSHKVASPQKETFLSPLHKRKADESNENSKRCCHENSLSLIKPEHNHPSLTPGSIDESVSNVQLLYDKVPSFEHFDFMDAAVAVAIQKKGLSALACTEYG